MIKLGIFGDQSISRELFSQLNSLPEIELAGLFLLGDGANDNGLITFSSPTELMDISDAVLILGEKCVSNEFIKLVLRKSKHIYMQSIPDVNVREMKELIDLEREAAIVNYIFNPFDYIPHFDPLINTFEKPVLINIRNSFDNNSLKPSSELLLLVTAINRVVQSNYKKTEVIGIVDFAKQLVINLRVEYENGSVANLTVSSESSLGNVEIFHAEGRKYFDFEIPLYISYRSADQLYNSIENFVRMIQFHHPKTNSFDHLMNGLWIMEKVSENFHFNGISF
jgi:hypothetical protein